MRKIVVLFLLTILILGLFYNGLSIIAAEQANINVEEISDKDVLRDKIETNKLKKLHVLFYYKSVSSTLKYLDNIKRFIYENNGESGKLIIVPVDELGFGEAHTYNLQRVPTLVIFNNASEIVRFESHGEIKKWMNKQEDVDSK